MALHKPFSTQTLAFQYCLASLCIQHKNLHSVTSLVIFLYETLNVMIAFIERNLLKMLMKHMLSLLSFWWKETEGAMESLWKKYLIPQMVHSIWESIFGLLSIVSLAWPEHIKPHLKSNFVSKHLWKRNPIVKFQRGKVHRTD